MRLIDADALMAYCNNQKIRTVDANDIARFPTAKLLEEQKPKKVIRKQHRIKNESGSVVTVWAEYYCPDCFTIIARGYSRHYPYCMWCGSEVDWNDT